MWGWETRILEGDVRVWRPGLLRDMYGLSCAVRSLGGTLLVKCYTICDSSSQLSIDETFY